MFHVRLRLQRYKCGFFSRVARLPRKGDAVFSRHARGGGEYFIDDSVASGCCKRERFYVRRSAKVLPLHARFVVFLYRARPRSYSVSLAIWLCCPAGAVVYAMRRPFAAIPRGMRRTSSALGSQEAPGPVMLDFLRSHMMPALVRLCAQWEGRSRPHRGECAGSLPHSEAKRRRARSVLGWGTAWEALRVPRVFV